MALKVTRAAARGTTHAPAPGCTQLRCRRIKVELNQPSKVAPSPVVTTRASGIEQPAVSRGLANASPTSTLESSVDEAVQSSIREALTRLGIAAIAPEDLFDQQHIQEWTPLLLAYLPFGCALALIRMAAWVGGIALDASWFRNSAVIDAYMALLGVTVKWEGEQHIPAQVGPASNPPRFCSLAPLIVTCLSASAAVSGLSCQHSCSRTSSGSGSTSLLDMCTASGGGP